MANFSHTTLLLLLLTLTLFRSSQAARGIAVSWGQNDDEGTLAETCRTGKYRYVIISFLSTFGNGQTPRLNLGSHCIDGDCVSLSTDILECQSMFVQVLLSIGGPSGSYSLSSDEVDSFARYLWDAFLGGQSSLLTFRALGPVTLDGIDFNIQKGAAGQPWDKLAQALVDLRRDSRYELTATPQCPFPDPYLDAAIQTRYFLYLWVQFYNNPGCEYDGSSVDNLLASWKQWAVMPAGQIFMGLPAASTAAESGYIDPAVLNSQVLPVIKTSQKYGGVMLWNRYYDKVAAYSTAIMPSL